MVRKTKIVCTIGPAIDSPEMIEKMILAGMNVARLNFSHGTQEEHTTRINMVREVAKKLGKHVGILADTKGPEIRTGKFENGGVDYKKGDIVKIYKEDILGTKEGFHISVPELFDDVTMGDYLLIDDGKVRLNVLENKISYLVAEVANSGKIKDKKGVNTPSVHVSMPFVSKKDSEDIAFAVQMDVDMIALSFVRTPEDVKSIRSILNFLKKIMEK